MSNKEKRTIEQFTYDIEVNKSTFLPKSSSK